MIRTRRARARAITCTIAVAALLSTGCASAIIGGAVLAVGIGAAALTYECEEGISVTLWDPSSAHGVCDATVTAREENGKEIGFSPCFAGYLGKGTWTITAQKPGYLPAQGIVVIPPEHKCSEPVYHSLELTLRPERPAYGAPPSYGPPPAYAPPPSYGVPRAYGPEPAPAPAPSSSAAPNPAPSPAPGTQSPTAPGAPPPTGAFPIVPDAPPTH